MLVVFTIAKHFQLTLSSPYLLCSHHFGRSLANCGGKLYQRALLEACCTWLQLAGQVMGLLRLSQGLVCAVSATDMWEPLSIPLIVHPLLIYKVNNNFLKLKIESDSQ